MNIDAAILAGVSTISLSAIATALISFGELKEFKKNTANKIDTNFDLLKEEIIAHEERDNNRHEEIIDRIGIAEKNILETYKSR